MIVYGKERDYIIHDDQNIKGFFGEYRFLSNFEISDVYFDGDVYNCSEAAYMAGKTLDQNIRNKFIKSSNITPRQARELGQTFELRDNWINIKYDVMSAVLFDKFYRNVNLRRKLLITGNKYLEETNHWNDVYWGVCNGKGENNLGKILMNIRTFWKKPGFII
jgi:ribA/ribD-fused uncharacterized protein